MGNKMFFLQDPHDFTCLGPDGFVPCDESALWILTRRDFQEDKYSLLNIFHRGFDVCLDYKVKWFRKNVLALSSCKHKGTKLWEFDFLNATCTYLISYIYSL